MNQRALLLGYSLAFAVLGACNGKPSSSPESASRGSLKERLATSKPPASDSQKEPHQTKYVVAFQSSAEAEQHKNLVISKGGTAKALDSSGRVLEMELPSSQLSEVFVSDASTVLNNSSWTFAKNTDSSQFAASTASASARAAKNSDLSDASFAQNLVTARKETGVEALVKRFPTADGRGLKVAVLDTGIDFGLNGISTFADGRPKVRSFVDLTPFGRRTLKPFESTDLPMSLNIEGKEIALGAGFVASQILSTGVLKESDLAKEMREPEGVDLNGNKDFQDAFPFALVALPDGTKSLWIDANQDGTFAKSSQEELKDFNSTYKFIDLKGTAGAQAQAQGQALAVTIRSNTEVQFHTILGGHGTSCASIIAGEKYLNGKVDGMAPGAELMAYVIDATGRDVYSSSELLQMFLSAKDNGADAISVSWGFATADLQSARAFAEILDREIASKGIVIGIAAGNEGPGSRSASPDDYVPRLGFALGAAITERQAKNVYNWLGVKGDHVIHYSSVGPTRGGRAIPDLISPLMTLVRGERDGGNRQYTPFGGTSSATPAFVGSTMVLVSALNEQGIAVDPVLLKTALLTSARPLKGVPLARQGAGLVNVNAAYDKYLELAAQKAAGSFENYTLIPTVKVLGKDLGEGLVSAEFVNAADISLSLNTALSLSPELAGSFVQQLKVVPADGWLKTPEIVTVQGAGGGFPVQISEEISKKPGLYRSEIRLIDAQGNLRGRIPVHIEVAHEPSSQGFLFSINETLAPFLVKSVPLKLDAPSALDVSGTVLASPTFSKGRLSVTVTNSNGQVMSAARLDLDGNVNAIQVQTETLPAGQYEIQVFQQTGSVVEPIQVTLGVELVPYKVTFGKSASGKMQVLVENPRARPLTKMVFITLGREAKMPLVAQPQLSFPAMVGYWKFAPDELQNRWDAALLQSDFDRKTSPFLMLATSFRDAQSLQPWSWDWMPVNEISKPKFSQVFAEGDSEQVQIEAYPNVGDWERLKDLQMNALVRTYLKTPVTAEMLRSGPSAKGNWLATDDGQLSSVEGSLFGKVELFNGEKSVGSYPIRF